ncbi:chloride channel CLIC-like protein 1 [Branchiostoma floridae]|uniref:Chloride channel CLIC-like protein 1 n=1 Tax=Branchiostoma floridae TaxID=7739 RepID=A0A9J7LG52_BRAFL|nr:chloride channel CLIC-like protein 1 [Branchiostoma floridae]
MSSFLGLTAILAALLCCGHCQDPDLGPPDMEDWVDPGDMLNYNSDSRTMKNHRDQPRLSEKQLPGAPEAPAACAVQLQEQQQLQKQLQTCQLRLQSAEQTCQADQQSSHQAKEAPYGGGQEAPYVRRFVRGLLKQLGDVMEPTGDMHEVDAVDYDVHMTVTAENWLLLNKFIAKDQAKDQGSLQDTMQVLETLITGVSSRQAQVNRWQKRLEDYTGLEVQVLMQAVIMVLLVLCLVALEIWSHVSWRKQFLRLLLIGFLISVGWTWMHEYKKAHAKKQGELSKQMPRECRTADRTALHGIFEWFSSAFTLQEDKCANYHEALVVDAFWEVTPTKAFAVTLTKFFLEPMEHIGRSFSKFFGGVFHDLPVQLWPLAFLAVMLMSLLLMIMMAGYSINIPFIFSLQPRAVNTVTLPLETQTCMEDTRQQVLQVVNILKEQQRAMITDGTAPHVRLEQQRADGTAHLQVEQQRAAIGDRVEQVTPAISQANASGSNLPYNQTQNRINLSRGVSFTRNSSASSRPLAAGPHAAGPYAAGLHTAGYAAGPHSAGPHSKSTLLQRSHSAPIQEGHRSTPIQAAPIQEAPIQTEHRDHAQKMPQEESEDSESEETEANTETLGPQEGRGHVDVRNISLD